MVSAAALGRAGGPATGHTLVTIIRIVGVSHSIMRPLVCAVAFVLLSLPASWVRAQEDLVNCEAFSSGFTTPQGCIDGSQPSSGPMPTHQELIGDDWDEMPFGWYGSGDSMDF